MRSIRSTNRRRRKAQAPCWWVVVYDEAEQPVGYKHFHADRTLTAREELENNRTGVTVGQLLREADDAMWAVLHAKFRA